MKICIEYVWIGGNNELRSKTKVQDYPDLGMNYEPNLSLNQIPEWNYDGSSTNQASGEDSEIIIKPRSVFNDPFRSNRDYMVMCDTYQADGKPHKTNYRNWANDIFNQKLDEEPWFGLEQEYFLISADNNTATRGAASGRDDGYWFLGFERLNDHNRIHRTAPNVQGQYYCSAGAENSFGRNISEEHLSCCIKAGIKISGINGEVAPGQWEFQIGPCVGIEQGDHLWMARYILLRIAEKHNIIVNFEPKPFQQGDWNGSGCHTNYSTKKMREDNGLELIIQAIHKLEQKHNEHMESYGSDNEKRMTGNHETASFNKFTYGIGNRGCSVRIGNDTYKNKKGYFEDRRPSSNCDPYLVIGKIFKTTVLK